MSKMKYYYIKFQKIKDPDIKYRGIIVEAKRERSALFIARVDYGLKEGEYNFTRCVEILKKTFDRLDNLKKLRKQKEHEIWLKNGGKKKAMQHLANLAALNAKIGGPY